MAGYIITLDSLESLKLYTMHGVYATKLSMPAGIWKQHHEGTFADYATMKPGDNVYFFIKRKIYGIGELVKVGRDCKFSNFPGACTPDDFTYEDKKQHLLWDEGEFSADQRWLCVFKPSPYFFAAGVDMDDVLSSKPSAFRMLRALWKLSFMKFDDEENQAFKDIILKINQDILLAPQLEVNVFPSSYERTHEIIERKLISADYSLNIADILSTCSDGDYIKHEMAIEAGLLYQLAQSDSDTLAIFGAWDYLSHQVIASPFKPIDYMDKLDVFGYSYVYGFSPTRSKYLVAELKKDEAGSQDIEQLLKYVDWVKDEYCFGDYSMVKAFLVAYSFSEDTINDKSTLVNRKFIVGRRPARSSEWDDLSLVKYFFNPATFKIDFRIVG